MTEDRGTKTFDTVIREVTRYRFISRLKRCYVYHYKVVYIDGSYQYFTYSNPVIKRFINNAECTFSTVWKGRHINVFKIKNSTLLII